MLPEAAAELLFTGVGDDGGRSSRPRKRFAGAAMEEAGWRGGERGCEVAGLGGWARRGRWSPERWRPLAREAARGQACLRRRLHGAEEAQQQILRDTFHMVLRRDEHVCNFLECGRYRAGRPGGAASRTAPEPRIPPQSVRQPRLQAHLPALRHALLRVLRGLLRERVGHPGPHPGRCCGESRAARRRSAPAVAAAERPRAPRGDRSRLRGLLRPQRALRGALGPRVRFWGGCCLTLAEPG